MPNRMPSIGIHLSNIPGYLWAKSYHAILVLERCKCIVDYSPPRILRLSKTPTYHATQLAHNNRQTTCTSLGILTELCGELNTFRYRTPSAMRNAHLRCRR